MVNWLNSHAGYSDSAQEIKIPHNFLAEASEEADLQRADILLNV